MAWLPTAGPNATEGKMVRTPTGNAVFLNGAFYVLQTPLTADTTNGSAVSLFLGDPWSSSPASTNPTVSMGQLPFTQYPGSTRIMPPGSLTPGTMFNADFLCNYNNNNGTPNLTLTWGLIGPYPSTNYTVLATTGATAQSAISGSTWAHIQFGASITAYGTLVGSTVGAITSWLYCEYGQGGVQFGTPLTVTSIDTTQQYTIDLRATWSASSCSLQLAYGDIEVIG